MDSLADLWALYLVLFFYVVGVFYFCVACMAFGGTWWEPFVLPILVPLEWIYRKRVALTVVFLLLVVLRLLWRA